MPKKTIFTLSAFLSLFMVASCTEQERVIENDSIAQDVAESHTNTQMAEDQTLTFTTNGKLSFDYPFGWQILTMQDIDLIESYKASAEQMLDSPISSVRAVEINFDRPHDIGPYDRTVDIWIRDYTFEEDLVTASDFVTKKVDSWEQDGELEEYTSPAGIDFVVWSGQSPVYEADLVFYVTEYDHNGERHVVEVSRMGADHKVLKEELETVVDSLSFE